MFFRVLSTEFLKLKRTLALWMVLASPLVLVLLEFVVSYRNAHTFLQNGKDEWAALARQTVQAWTLLIMPLFITLETSLLAGLENTGKNWKSLLALPAPRWTVYVSKLLVTVGLLWAAHTVLIAGSIASGRILHFIYPSLNLGGMPLSPFALPMLKVSVSALLAVAIQHWVSLRWQTYTAAMGFGIGAMISGVFASQSADIGPWFPWSLPIRVVLDAAAAVDRITILAVAGAILATAMGCWEFIRREIG